MESHPPRSARVTVIAWFFIVFAACATVFLTLQNVLIWKMFPAKELETAMNEARDSGILPPAGEFVFRHLPAIMMLLLVASAGTLVTAIGLHMRWNWARLVFIGIMVAGIVANVCGLLFQYGAMTSMEHARGVPADVRSQVESVANLTVIVSAATTVLFSALCVGVILFLNSARIRREFS